MTLEILAKENLNFYAPRFVVEVEDKKLDVNVSKDILNVEVTEKLDEGASFKLTLHDKFDTKTQKFKWIDDPLFDFGKKISIKIGYGSNLYNMIEGEITSFEPSFFASETPTLTIGGQDPSYDFMKRATPEKTFVDKTYSDIARMIAQEAGLPSIVDSTEMFEPIIYKKDDETYYAFLNDIKKKVGFSFYIKEQTMYFVKLEDDKKEILKLELGKDIISFNPTMKTTGLLAEVEVRGHNPKDPNKSFIVSAKAEEELLALLTRLGNNFMPKKVITDKIVNSKKHANEIAKAELNKASYTFIEGTVVCIGLPQIRTGVSIVLDKMGERFNGKYYVKGTTHTIDDSGYKTQFSVISKTVKRL
ncbi:MAG: hypothetical protein QG646_2358 [Euryarchaeota archaeon]|nr:hypothetical protein [Euryarchaeota archaeon]